MLRGIHKLCRSRGLLQVQISSYQLSCKDTMSNANIQNLPKLPVPNLEDTIQKYLRSAKPHLSEEEFAVTSSLAKDFLAKDGVGRKLQGLLEKRAEKHLNWLEEWWLNTAYLEFRESITVFSNAGIIFPFCKFNSQTEQLQHAARTILATFDYRRMIVNNEIPIDKMGKAQLDMGQYKKILGTCRLPGDKRDVLSFNIDSKYITVIHNNHMFHLDIWGEDDVILNVDQIVEQLKKIIQMSGNCTNESIGILTTEHRDNWAKAYKILIQDNINKESLQDVERSLVTLNLDSAVGLYEQPSEDARRTVGAAQLIHGGGTSSNGGNRWFDKAVQLIVGADGVTGLNFEHGPADAKPFVDLTDHIVEYIDKGKAEKKSPSSKPKEPVLLKFNINSEVKGMIQNASNYLDKLAGNLEFNCFKYDKYGKNFIKSQKFSPDSYVQMAMQFAIYRLDNKPAAHYESAGTRIYVGGRTETIRSCSIESVEFAKAMLSSQTSKKEKMIALQKAIEGHKNYASQAVQGFGVDRHLLGLKLTAKENNIELHKLFSDPGFTRSLHMRLSTSQVPFKCTGFAAYGPLVLDGYATCYNPRDDYIDFATSAFVDHPDTNCSNYRAMLEKSLQDMHDICLANVPSKL